MRYRGGKIAEIRATLGLTQSELATRLGITVQTVRYWESNPEMILKEKYTPPLDGLVQQLDNNFDEKKEMIVVQDFTKKVKSNLHSVRSFIDNAVALFMVVKDPRVKLAYKSIAIGALVYFISPVDAIPDIIPVTGFLDDAGVITSAIGVLGIQITEEHKEQARKFVERLW